jgi:hypothetical protein
MSIGLIMSLYPQVIVHSSYKGNQFSQYQLVYVKTNLPHDASVKGLCHDIIQKIDNLIGTNYSRKTRNLAVNKLVPTIGQIFSNTSLGCLIIDEIQHLTFSKQGQKAMIGFLLNIMSLGFPVVLLGTNISNSILQKELRLARRGSGMGTVLFNRIEDKDSMEWRLLTNMLFHCRILKEEFDDEERLREVLFTMSQGIIDICAKIYVESQIECLRRKKENLTVDIIQKTVNNRFSFVQPMLEAISSNDYYRMSLYEDIIPINAAINSRNGSSITRNSSNNRAKAKELFKIEKELEVELKTSMSNVKNDQKNSGAKKNKIEVDQLYDDDIRKIISSGKDKKMSEYESLKEAGLIGSL